MNDLRFVLTKGAIMLNLSLIWGIFCVVVAIFTLIFGILGFLQKGFILPNKSPKIQTATTFSPAYKRKIYFLQAISFFMCTIIFAALAVNSFLELQIAVFIGILAAIFMACIFIKYAKLEKTAPNGNVDNFETE
ncbi:MAG: hypothetical protein FWG64_13870 [Firmicutes bacterium]|nr:hypothetical protein [Bacillota bacterium]